MQQFEWEELISCGYIERESKCYEENIIVHCYYRLRGILECPDPEIREIKVIMIRDEDEMEGCKAPIRQIILYYQGEPNQITGAIKVGHLKNKINIFFYCLKL